MSASEQSVQPKKKSVFLPIFVVVCSAVGMILGGVKMYQGITEIFSSGADPQYQQLLDESDQAIAEANKLNQAVQPQFVALMNDVDSLGLEVVRKQKRDFAQQVSQQFGKVAAQFRLAAQKADEAATHKIKEEFAPFFVGKARSYRFFADASDHNREIITLVLDSPITKFDELLPKLKESAGRRDAAEKEGAQAAAQAEKLIEELNAPPKS